MDGGAVDVEVTEKMSVRHLPALVDGSPPVYPVSPLSVCVEDTVVVDGPVIEKVSKSSLN